MASQRRPPSVPRPTPKTAYRVIAKSDRVLADWEEMLRTRVAAATACWDHIARTPLTPVGSRYTRLKGSLATCEFQGEHLPQWQWEIDRRARVKVGVGRDFVVIVDASMGHPKENE